jgi:hypothetical protein
MKTIRITKLVIAVSCLLAAANGSWGALTYIQVTALNGVNNINSTAYLNDQMLVVSPGSSGGAAITASSSWSGAWVADIKSGPGYGSADPFLGFCTDIANQMPNSGSGGYAYEAHLFSDGAYGGMSNPETGGNPPDPNWANSGSGGRAAWVYNTYIGVVKTATDNNAANAAALRSAMAIAIWEALYEGSGTFDVKSKSTSGRSFAASGSGLDTIVSVNTTIAQLANSWLNSGAPLWAGFNSTWWAEQSSTGYGDVQSLMGPVSAVPEPTTVVAGLLLLLPFGASTLRTFRRTRAA